ncbi:ion channel [Altericroceibacterium xinjiangense]|uniref:ion channel n=1 Tax=Altericroceibacterium xinjiangense TaxID=762261 RepID=UPI000F7DD363|nr:ion channel [Altericroceibacterium xinjiangense]
MDTFYLILGIALLVLVAVDALWTALWVDGGAGPLSSRMSTWLWHSLLGLVGSRHHRGLSLFGPFFLVFGLLTWIGLLWAGWVFVFAGEPSSLQHSSDKSSADWAGRIYFVGYMMFTAGNGDYKPQGDVWQLVSAATNASGMILVTLALTYLISVLSAVVAKRALASDIAGLGSSSQDLLLTGWNGKDFRSLDFSLSALGSSLSALSQQYESYPILQYYHAARAAKSPIVAVAKLDEALSILHHGVPEDIRPNPALLHAARSSVESFLETMPGAFIDKAPHAPSAPDLSKLRDAGVPTVSEQHFASALEEASDRRRMLLGGVRDDGWEWKDVTGE